ncbi:hypothetical protein BDK51DRAFT_48524 [Blyttiomyces helicus]|uniref:Uncharacterized protein n=1 Tax=Blyttiomyces helicus TaxID=388810 RepID=A0A4P9W237_9FUNG|nr:hypothetical protein BDK51DRAFT_48524 [Blyttiomyces helicus]|eukprot:RKO86184.1 hypothetical protein BDK51DRAFT_48524 [Blyttiomyces helicus]
MSSCPLAAALYKASVVQPSVRSSWRKRTTSRDAELDDQQAASKRRAVDHLRVILGAGVTDREGAEEEPVDKTILAVLENHIPLTSLRLEGYELPLSSAALQRFLRARGSNLLALDLGWNHHVDLELVASLPTSCPRLESLFLSGCTEIVREETIEEQQKPAQRVLALPSTLAKLDGDARVLGVRGPEDNRVPRLRRAGTVLRKRPAWKTALPGQQGIKHPQGRSGHTSVCGVDPVPRILSHTLLVFTVCLSLSVHTPGFLAFPNCPPL